MTPAEIAGIGRGYRYYQKINPNANEYKFWAIRIDNDTSVTAWWGRINTIGQTETWRFTTREQCERFAGSRTQEKLSKGYDPVAPADSPPPGKNWRVVTPDPRDEAGRPVSPMMKKIMAEGVNADGWKQDERGRGIRPESRPKPGQPLPRPPEERAAIWPEIGVPWKFVPWPEEESRREQAKARPAKPAPLAQLTRTRVIDLDED